MYQGCEGLAHLAIRAGPEESPVQGPISGRIPSELPDSFFRPLKDRDLIKLHPGQRRIFVSGSEQLVDLFIHPACVRGTLLEDRDDNIFLPGNLLLQRLGFGKEVVRFHVLNEGREFRRESLSVDLGVSHRRGTILPALVRGGSWCDSSWCGSSW
jgi:hypothetical protein